MNFDRLRFVAEEAELGEQREAILAVTIPERPGSFRRFCATLGARNVTEFNYRIADPNEAHVFVGVQVRDREETARIVRNLRRHGCRRSISRTTSWPSCTCVTWWAAARRSPGTRSSTASSSRSGPARSMNFLESMRGDWNISLFHYRNHGADYGRVLVGMQVPRAELGAFRRFLKKLGYPYADETRNPAYKLFLL